MISFNSSNWVSVLAQLVFYFHAVLQLGGGQRPIGFSVPAASFAEVYAGYIAQKMGLPITQMIVATNQNDALHQLFQKNHYSRSRANKTLSPAMDLSIFSNLERFLWELYGHDDQAVCALMEGFESSGEMVIANEFWLQARMIIDSYAVSDEQTLTEITSLYRDTGYVIDPHTATGVLAARLYRRSLVAPMVTPGKSHRSSRRHCLASWASVWRGCSLRSRHKDRRRFTGFNRTTSTPSMSGSARCEGATTGGQVKRILDPLDEHIIAQLQLNARAAHAELAAKVNLSRNAVRQRIERLERDGVIQGYTIRTGRGDKPRRTSMR